MLTGRGEFGAMKPRRRLVLAVAVVVALASTGVGVGLAVSSDDGVYIPELGITVPAGKVQAARNSLIRRTEPESTVVASEPPLVFDRIPAEIRIADSGIPVSPTLVRPTTYWVVSDGKTFTSVIAGSAGENPNVGRIVIVRQKYELGEQTQHRVDVAGSGALRIDNAPTGTAVETTAQTGTIHVRGVSGYGGTLRLQDDSITPD